jgi:hypothetical protein
MQQRRICSRDLDYSALHKIEAKDFIPTDVNDIQWKRAFEAAIYDSTKQQHIQYAANKGTKFALAISRIAKSTWGSTYKHTRDLFNAVVSVRMDYVAIVWHRPTKHERPQASLSKLETAQRTAMKAILGMFRTTTTLSMEIDTSFLPHT